MTNLTEPLKLPGGVVLHRLAIEIDTICPSPTQPRKNFDPAGIDDLAASITKHGLLEPIILRPWPSDYAHQPSPRPHYELVAGERRWRAAKIAGLTAIESQVRELTDEQALEIQLIENLKRKDLTEIEEADGYARMVAEYKYSAEKIAEQIGQSKSYVYGRLKLATLCHEGRKAFAAGKIDASKGLLIARIPTGALQEQALLEITNADWQGETMSCRKAAEHVQRKYMLKLNEAPFNPNDQDLVPTAGKCKLCPRRSGNAADLFSDVKNANVCTDPECYQTKVKAHQEREIKAAREQGLKVITGKAAEKILPYGLDADAKEGMVALDRKTWVGGKETTYRELIGENVKPTALVEDTKTGGMVPVVEKKQVTEAMKVAGINSGNDLQAKQQKEAEQAAKRENDYRRKLHDQVRGAIRSELEDEQAPALEREELVMVAGEFYSRLWEEHRKRIAALWLPLHAGPARDRMAVFREVMPTWSSAELLILLLDMALIGETHVSYYQADSKPEKPLELARHSNIDAAAIKKSVGQEGKAKAAKKKPQAPKPAAKVQPETAKTAGDEIKVGDWVIITEKSAIDGIRNTYEGKEAEVVEEDSETEWALQVGSGALIVVAKDAVSLVAAAISESTPTPTEAARAAEPYAAEEPVPARRKAGNQKRVGPKPVPAATEPKASSTMGAWPFPSAQAGSPGDRLNKAARADESRAGEKSSDRACPVERNGKSKKVMNAKPPGARPEADGAEVVRCDKTVDMFEEGRPC